MKRIEKFLAGSIIADATLGERQIRVVANSGNPDRDGDRMIMAGVKLANYRNNNVVLADHDRLKTIGNFGPVVSGTQLEGLIDFCEAGIDAKADEYCAKYKTGVMRGLSIGFTPIKAIPNEFGGLDYLEWELNELSCVAIGCDPDALVIERSGESAGHLFKCGASLNLPVIDGVAFDPDKAAAAIFDKAGFGTDKPDIAFARKGFLLYDAANPLDKTAYAYPFADVVDGRLMAVKAALPLAAREAGKLAGKLDDQRAKALKVVQSYEGQMAKRMTKAGAPANIKGLYDVAQFAYLLNSLGYVHDEAVREAISEGDNSKVPGLIADGLVKLAAAFKAMSAEEVDEMLSGRGLEADDADETAVVVEMSGPNAIVKRWDVSLAKAGRAMSAANVEHVKALEKCISAMSDCQTKALDAHADAQSATDEFGTHLEKAQEHVKALKSATKKKPSPKPEADEDGDDEEGDDEDDDDDDVELALARDRERRKRALDFLDVTKAA